MPRSMETLPGGDQSKVQNLDRPQKPLVLYDKSEAKPKTSKMDIVPLMV